MTKKVELEPWMKGRCEVRANGYSYPCEVIQRSVLGYENYLIRIFLPNNSTHVMTVDRHMLTGQSHYNPAFDRAKIAKTRKEEFLFPIGSFVKTKFNGKKIFGKVTKYNPATEEYTVLISDGIPYTIQRAEDKLKLDKNGKDKPAAKFKIGDHVRVFNIGSTFHNDIGKVLTATYADGNWSYTLGSHRLTNKGQFMEAHLVPVKQGTLDEFIKHPEPKFKIGQMVQYQNSLGTLNGKIVAWSYVGKPEGHVYAIQISDKNLKYRVNNVYETALSAAPEEVVANREKTEEVERKVSEKVTVKEVPLFEPGEAVLVCTHKIGDKESWIPAVIAHEDTQNPIKPATGSRWMIKFAHDEHKQQFKWSYPSKLIKKVEIEDKVEAETKPVEEKTVEEKFKKGDEVVILSGMFEGQRGVINKKYEEVINLKANFWVIDLDGNKKQRIIGEKNLALWAEEEKAKAEEKIEESPEDEFVTQISDVFSGFFKMAEDVISNGDGKLDFKKFVDTIGPIKEYFGKGK